MKTEASKSYIIILSWCMAVWLGLSLLITNLTFGSIPHPTSDSYYSKVVEQVTQELPDLVSPLLAPEQSVIVVTRISNPWI